MTSRTMLTILFMVAALQSHAQLDDEYRWEAGAGLGFTGYLGDFNGNISKNQQPSATLLLRRVFNPSMTLKLAGTLGKLKGNAKDVKTVYPELSEKRYAFSKSLIDLGVAYEYNLWPYGTGHDYRGAKPFTPYVMAGLGTTYVSGNGQHTFTANIPLGAGLKYKLNERLNIGLEWAMHFSLSDQLDGVKDPYGIESKGAFKNTDSYTTLQLTLTYSFAPKCTNCNKDF
ncbi:outer membrane beta-barrel protein [Prevotella sp. A2931]|uniref:Outer membrane beta-barrel protein n=2 Tax=Prevotellaceae TaxID=171552 RepID=A0ABS3M6N3_9BACT|nr:MULTISPECIES: DUF6089 family protein [Prevotella]MBO1363794.1 outer membrane beta-barrel protein [Prevotella illustrans]PTL26834.1 hypothetical protein C3V39_07165 [Prevotella sp. oral taxon 820]